MGINNYGLNQLVCGTYEMIGAEMSRTEYLKKSIKQITDCFVKARKVGIYEDRMEHKVRAFTSGEFYSIDCGAYGQQIIVQPNGALSICHADWEYNVGHVDSPINYMWELPIVTEWKSRLPIYNLHCWDCEAI